MKKILLLVSGLLILCMAGSAMAFTGQIYSSSTGGTPVGNPINMTSGQTITVYLGGSQIDPAYFNKDFSWNFNVNGASGGNVNDVTITAQPGSRFTPNSANYIDPDPITISLKDSTPGASYSVSIGASYQDQKLLYEGSVVSRIINSVPEFPTVAAPIAGIIGLLFVFGRKKEGL